MSMRMDMIMETNLRVMFVDGTKPDIDEKDLPSTPAATTSTYRYPWLEEVDHDCATGQLSDNLHIGMC